MFHKNMLKMNLRHSTSAQNLEDSDWRGMWTICLVKKK